MKILLFLLALLGLASCTAPKNASDAASSQEKTKPVYRGSRFGMGVGVGYSEPAPEVPKVDHPENQPETAKPAAPVDSKPTPPAAESAAPNPKKPLFSFFSKKPDKPQDPKVQPAPEPVKTVKSDPPAAKPAPAAVPNTPPPARPKPLFSFLSKKPGATEDPKSKSVPAPAAPRPERKPLFSFLMKKEPPKALVVAPPPTPKKSTQEPKIKELPVDPPKSDDGGLRLPDMLTMPEKNEFESTNPSAAKPQGGGAVIARPPTDPPSRPKNKENP